MFASFLPNFSSRTVIRRTIISMFRLIINTIKWTQIFSVSEHSLLSPLQENPGLIIQKYAYLSSPLWRLFSMHSLKDFSSVWNTPNLQRKMDFNTNWSMLQWKERFDWKIMVQWLMVLFCYSNFRFSVNTTFKKQCCRHWKFWLWLFLCIKCFKLYERSCGRSFIRPWKVTFILILIWIKINLSRLKTYRKNLIRVN